MTLPDGAWHLYHGIQAGLRYGVGIPPYACRPSAGFWPRTSATLALAIRETELVARIEANRAKAHAEQERSRREMYAANAPVRMAHELFIEVLAAEDDLT